MSLASGTRLGPYEVLSPLGAGGMGEVYRAKDTRLDRTIALKVLPGDFTADPERVARFAREARMLAQLTHPSIAAVFGFETVEDRNLLTMELVEGEGLDVKISQGPIPLEEALSIARQIAEALEAAHEKAIIHRDLKPANVMVTPEGGVKILDFGLAKAYVGETAEASGSNLTQSPTLSAKATVAGVILGTAAYMSPEQARGRAVDRRADIWAFGVVLFEMLTGRRLFEGEDVSDVLAAVLRQQPDWSALPAETPASVRKLLRRCLERDPKKRLRDIGDARLELQESPAEEAAAVPSTAMEAAAPVWKRAVPWVLGGAILGAAAILTLWAPWRRPPRPSPLRVSAELGADVSLVTNIGSGAVLSPDGSLLAFVGEKGGMSQLYVRRLDQLQATPLSGTLNAFAPFFSPDGQWLAFFADGRLKKVSIAGGAVVTLCEAPNGRGGTWAEDDMIYFLPQSGSGQSLQRVSAAGGKPEPAANLVQGEVTQRWPQVLPGGKALLYTGHESINNFDEANIVVAPLPKGAPKILVRGGYHARYVSSGHLVYMHEATLFAVPFDLGRLSITGPAVPALEGVAANPVNAGAQFAVASNGALVYLPGESTKFARPIDWMDREGKTSVLRAAPADWVNPRFSPDGKRLALQISDGKQEDVWIYEWGRDTLSRLTFDPADDRSPVWTPDGRRIVFGSNRAVKSAQNLWWQRADGTGEPQRLTESPNIQTPVSWHPSGRFLAFVENNPKTAQDLMILPMEGDEASGWKPGKPTVFLSTPFVEVSPEFSPDGQWIAYTSNESGRFEVYVRPFPGPGGKWQVSTDGGGVSLWSRVRREI
ncbi:MAG TPA: protein kinase, partial [Thermoanaerobaculia bacterium]|nr:protein kinase [Thermoanaerobaculia bacterium]